MTDYSSLADKLKGSGQAAKPVLSGPAKHEVNLGAIYEGVKAQIIEEIAKANVELRKRDLPVIERIFMPGFFGRLSLTFGTALLCTVELQEAKERIVAVTVGPPNRREISRTEYPLSLGAAKPEVSSANGAEEPAHPEDPGRIAAEIISDILEIGIRLTQKRSSEFEAPEPVQPVADQAALLAEFWISLASLLRSYTAMHGLHAKHEAAVELTEEEIIVRHGVKWLRLDRNHTIITWTRENGSKGTLELTESGTLRTADHEDALDLVAEQWARDLMLESPR